MSESGDSKNRDALAEAVLQVALAELDRGKANRKGLKDALDVCGHLSQVLQDEPAVALLARDGTFAGIDSSAARILGANGPLELDGRDFSDFVHPLSQQDFARMVAQAIEGRASFGSEHITLRTLDGSSAHVRLTLAPVTHPGKASIRVFMTRVSPREHDRCDGELAGILDESSTGMLVLENEGQVIFANRAALSLLEITEIPAGSNFLEYLPNGSPLLLQTTIPAKRQGRITLGAGAAKPIGFIVEPLGDRRLFLLWDESKSDEIVKRRNRSECLAVTDRLASSLNHRIKNALAGVLAGLQTLEKGSSLSSDDLYVLKLVLDEVRSLHHIINGLLESVRTNVSHPVRANVERLLRTSIGFLEPDAAVKDVALKVIPGEPNTYVTIDERAMARAVGNLVRNALEAVDRGGEIVVGWRQLDDSEKRTILSGFTGTVVGIFVEDSGPGLPEDFFKESILSPLATTKRSNIGLGLPVAQEIIELHGGVLLLGQSTGGGAFFEILLPVIGPDSQTQSVPAGLCEHMPAEHPDGTGGTEATGGSHFCWMAHGWNHRKETGRWPDACLVCSVFRSSNLTQYSDRSGLSRKV